MKNRDHLLGSKNKEIIVLGEKLSRVQSKRDKWPTLQAGAIPFTK